MLQTNVCIIGAGPGGAATALKLSYLGIPSILIDKAVFPRDKICGDALSGKVSVLFDRLDPEIMDRFRRIAVQYDVWGIRFVPPNTSAIDLYFPLKTDKDGVAPGYVTKRMDFDNFLIDEVKRRDNISFYEGTSIEEIIKTDNGFELSNTTGDFKVATRMLLVANGAYSAFTRKYAGINKEPKHYAGAVRAYYENVTVEEGKNLIELHFIDEIVPGYFWIFPLPNNQSNVGLGLRTDVIGKRKLNMKKCMEEIISTHPILSQRFKNASRLSDIVGYGLPLGSKRRTISGDHFMLIGDAAYLVDPMTGEGIGNAIYSGFMAAEQTQKCLEKNDFSAKFIADYDDRVERVLGKEMILSYRLQKMLSYPIIVKLIARIINGNKKIVKSMSDMYTDLEKRKQLINPAFWFKMMFSK